MPHLVKKIINPVVLTVEKNAISLSNKTPWKEDHVSVIGARELRNLKITLIATYFTLVLFLADADL